MSSPHSLQSKPPLDAFTRARLAMVERLRKAGIRDERVLAAMAEVPRHLFIPEALRSTAYGDHPLPIACDQTISQPFIVARETELLEITDQDRVLEIGAGSGYQTAILAKVTGRVFAIERIAQLARESSALLTQLKLFNATIKCFDGTIGWSEFAPYQGILVAAGAPEIPQPLLHQLAVGGHLVVPVGTEKEQRLMRVKRTVTGFKTEDHGRCQFVKLIGKFGWEK
ncbi:MAG TPA: protein-L-isoaspartate(D-aspartate) O-methyltransferase [Blastocatellia bacterium]|nr:protein-L-isoaspartate(D-aspartate) O-methyltransferase [Blastocatellia bacterium]